MCPLNPNIIPREDFVAPSLLLPKNPNPPSNENIATGIPQPTEAPQTTAFHDDTLVSPSIIADGAYNIDDLPVLIIDSYDEASRIVGLGSDEI